MKRLAGIAAAMLLGTLLFVPVALAAGPSFAHDGRVLISIGGDVTLPAGEHADAVIVINGTATILGEANSVVAFDGAVRLASGARSEAIFGLRSPVTLGPGSSVTGDVRTLSAAIERDPTATVSGVTGDLTANVAALIIVLAAAFILIAIGMAVATLVAAVALAGLAARQVRSAEMLISREPGTTFLIGLGGVVLTPVIAILAMATVIGMPLGMGILMVVWPLASFVGYLVAAIWVGDWVLYRAVGDPDQRPYRSAIVGVVILGLVSIVPLLGIVTAIATMFGFGAIVVLAWRVFRGQTTVAAPMARSAPAPMGA